MNILIIDDHTLFRTAIESMLTSLEKDITIQQFENCSSAIADSKGKAKVDLILLDYNIPGSSASENINRARNNFEHAKIVILSGEDEPEKIIQAIDYGVSGFIPKSSEPQVLIAALQLVLAGGVYLPEQVLRYQGTNKNENTSNSKLSPTATSLKNLSDRQLEVLMHVIDGKNNKTIAREVNLSLGTVKSHLSGAYYALGVSNRTEAVVLASKLLRLESNNIHNKH